MCAVGAAKVAMEENEPVRRMVEDAQWRLALLKYAKA
jgi:hypothetical protein